MDDEFKLCWKNFQDNIASGFQNLYDRGDLVDVTLACDGKLLQAHKIVLAICSPYFQEIFTTNPCKHPIIILKDVSFNIMLELLEFMYQGVVNVKHTELQSFMKIGQLLQIKGLATNPSSSAASTSSEKSSHLQAIDDEHAPHSKHSTAKTPTASGNANDSNPLEGNASASKVSSGGGGGSLSPARSRSQCQSPVPASAPPAPSSAANSPSPTPMSYVLNQHSLKSSPAGDVAGNVTPLLNLYHSSAGGAGGSGAASSSNAGGSLKRHLDAFSNDALSIYSRKQFRRSLPLSEHNSSLSGDQPDHNASDSNGGGPGGNAMGPLGEQVNHEDFFLPHISMVESRYDLNNLKREADHHSPVVAAAAAAAALRTFGPAFNFEYNPYKGSSTSTAAGGNAGGGGGGLSGNGGGGPANNTGQEYPNELHMPNDYSKNFGNHMDIPQISPGEHWFQGKLEFMLSQRGKPLLVHDGHTFGIQYVRKDKKYWQCNLSRKFNCKARVTTTDTGDIIVTNNEHCHTEIRQHLRKDYQRNKVMMNALINLSTNRLAENLRRSTLGNLMASSSATQSAGGHHREHHHQQHHQTPPLSQLAHHHQQQQQHHHNQSLSMENMDQSILDLGKAMAAASSASSMSPHRGMSTSSPVQQHAGGDGNDNDDGNDDDDMRPLDCGIRSMRETTHDIRQPTTSSSQQEASPLHGGVTDSENWKGKVDASTH